MLIIRKEVKYKYIDSQNEDWFHHTTWETYEGNVWSDNPHSLDFSVTGIVEDEFFRDFDDRFCSLIMFDDEYAYSKLETDDEIEDFRDLQANYIFDVDVELYLKSHNIFHESCMGTFIHIPVRAVW